MASKQIFVSGAVPAHHVFQPLAIETWKFDRCRGDRFRVFDRNDDGKDISDRVVAASEDEVEEIIYRNGIPVIADQESGEPKTRRRKGSFVVVKVIPADDEIPF